jgi:hypothetical protein
VREVDPNAEPTSVRVWHGLVIATCLLLLLRIFWPNQHLLMIAVLIGWTAGIHTGLLATFGARSTVLNLWFPRIKRKWLQGLQTEDQLLFSIRVLGILFLAFFLVLPFQKVIRNSIATHTVQHLGR